MTIMKKIKSRITIKRMTDSHPTYRARNLSRALNPLPNLNPHRNLSPLLSPQPLPNHAR